MTSELYEKIKDIVGEEHVTVSEFEMFLYAKDVSPLPPKLQEKLGTTPDIVVRPKSTEEVSEIVKVAAHDKIPVIPRGGASWWLGGSIPYKGGIVLDLTSMNQEIEVDEDNLIVTADCGVTWKDLEDILKQKGYFLGSRPSSAASATVGGWISTGGVGIGSYKYGSVGDLVRSLEVVLPNGEIIETASRELAGNGSGYNLNWLFIGGEGTLGIITKATLKITPKSEEGPYHIGYTFQSVKECADAIRDLVASRLLPHNIAFGDKRHFEILNVTEKPVPEGEIVLCVALEGEKGIIERGKLKLDEMLSSAGGGVMRCDGKSHEECEDCTLGFRGKGGNVYPVPGEVFVGLSRFEEVMEGIYRLVDEMGLTSGITGSMVDRRTVMIMPYYIHEKEDETTFMEFHRRLEEVALKAGGRRVGLGLFFSHSIHNIHDEGSVTMMRAIKSSIDPDNIMNPGKTIGEKSLSED
ncbi:MAG: FAD-binding oxidoreductase [Thermoplasmata archaeon]|nr:MAG: FAD-binding oxidoreductase [Thermoplasmata archaeon]